MIMNHWVQWGTLFSDKPICCTHQNYGMIIQLQLESSFFIRVAFWDLRFGFANVPGNDGRQSVALSGGIGTLSETAISRGTGNMMINQWIWGTHFWKRQYSDSNIATYFIWTATFWSNVLVSEWHGTNLAAKEQRTALRLLGGCTWDSSRFMTSTARTQGIGQREERSGPTWPNQSRLGSNLAVFGLGPNLGVTFAELGPVGSNLDQTWA